MNMPRVVSRQECQATRDELLAHDTYRVPVAEVEQTIRDACRRWQVVEIIADPFRWTRTLQALEAERLPGVEDPRGMRLAKASRSRSARKIDLAACLVMGHSRATWRAT